MKKVEFEEIIRLLKETDTPVVKLAESLGITRQTFYQRLNRVGISLKEYKRPHQTKTFSKEVLTELYKKKGLTVVEVAKRLKTSTRTVRRELRANGIRTRTRGGFRIYPDLSAMSIGDSFEMRLKDGKPLACSNIRREAKRMGIRIAIRRPDADTVVVTRTPKLSFQAISEMRAKGMSDRAIARVFLAVPRTIAAVFRKNKKGGDT